MTGCQDRAQSRARIATDADHRGVTLRHANVARPLPECQSFGHAPDNRPAVLRALTVCLRIRQGVERDSWRNAP